MVINPDDLIDQAVELAQSMTIGSNVAVALSKSILDQSFELPMEQLFALGRQAQAICYTSDEHHDAVTAFLDKRKS